MGTISITITPSTDQTLPGIPNTVILTTSEPATIFYTLDGTNPNTYSNIYVAPIIMPQNLLVVVLNIFAANQTDNSAVITQEYSADVSEITTQVGDRLPHAAVSPLNNVSTINSLFPFGTNSPNPYFKYKAVADSGITVYNETKPATSTGFDGQGNPEGFTNKPIKDFEFKQVYTTTNVEGEVYPGVGNLPATTKVIGKTTPVEYKPEFSDFADKIFDPRALVIFQDTTTEDPTNPVHINRPYFSLEDQEIVRDGNLLYNSTLDSPPTMGSFVNRYYNARTNMMTSYYYDNTVGRWIISTTPYQATTKDVGALYKIVFGRNGASGGGGNRVIPWTWNRGTYLI